MAGEKFMAGVNVFQHFKGIKSQQAHTEHID